jgi:hypothetical protein
LQVIRDINALPLQYLSRSPVRDQANSNYLSAQFPSPFSGLSPVYSANISRSGLLKPYPEFGTITAAEPTGYSWYHSLQWSMEKRLEHSYTIQAGYTWSKNMEATELQNAADPRPSEVISAIDRTHRFTVSFIWELPFGRGRALGGNASRALNLLFGGWQLNGVVQRQSGAPLGFGDVFTLFTGNPHNIVLPPDQRNVDRWFNTDAGFNKNAAQQLTDQVKTSPLRFSGVRAPGQARWDFSLFKDFPLVTERVKIQFRAECINAWNHPNLFGPNTTPTNSAFGRITAQDVPRAFMFSTAGRF